MKWASNRVAEKRRKILGPRVDQFGLEEVGDSDADIVQIDGIPPTH
jgi:hypothetical protein